MPQRTQSENLGLIRLGRIKAIGIIQLATHWNLLDMFRASWISLTLSVALPVFAADVVLQLETNNAIVSPDGFARSYVPLG